MVRRYPPRRNTPARQAWSALFVHLRNVGHGRFRNRENQFAGTKSFLNRRRNEQFRVHLDGNVPFQIDQLDYNGNEVDEPLVLEDRFVPYYTEPIGPEGWFDEISYRAREWHRR